MLKLRQFLLFVYFASVTDVYSVIQCGDNEVYDICPPIYPLNCLSNSDTDITACTPGCRCLDNYLRNEYGQCVPTEQLECFGKNEVAGCQNTCFPQTCHSIGKTHHCLVKNSDCKPECRCKENYFRNLAGDCVSREECLQCTGPNEYFSVVGPCDKFCDNLDQPNPTTSKEVDVICFNMCHCEEGYARNSNNVCVPISECSPKLKCTGPNEYFSSNGKCDKYCASLEQEMVTGSPVENRVCGNICHCEEGYARDFNNTCVSTAKCPKLNCVGQNEVSGCYIPCPPQTCESINGIALPCIPPPVNCQPECRCKDGYFRNKIGQCISKENCLKCTGPNEYFSYANTCDKFCHTLSNENQTSLKNIDVICINMCHCVEGYVRDSNNTCVPKSQCPPQLQCVGDNEVIDCHNTCPQTCEIIDKAYSCPRQPADCEPECRCKANYFRNKIGECISREDCLKCTGPYEYFSNNGKCDSFCASLIQDEGIYSSIDNRVCGNICHCEDGYARDFNNTCVPISKCPILECFGQNEVSGCYISCPPQTCESIGGLALPCVPPPLKCQPECHCKDGYYRNKIGECISKEDCLQCTGANEYFSPAGPCDNFCSILGPENQSNSLDRDVECINMCHCEKGYVRNSNNTCVPVSSCPPQLKCTGANEYYSSNGTCDKFCATLNQDGASSSIDDMICGTECLCEEGYARDFNNSCVPISECPTLYCSGENEVSSCYVSCPPQTCESIATENVRGKCVPPPVKCLAECRCKNNYYRNKIGKCISREDCLKCNGSNEYFSTNGACDKYCASVADGSNYLSENSRCGNICHCEEGYARDFNNTCVSISECPKLNCSGKNEVSGCHIPCPPQTCGSIGKAIPCIPPPIECQPECRCKNDFFRNKIGECISKEDCFKCSGPNEYYSSNNTTDKICATSIKQNKINSANNYTVRKLCHCEEGYARDSNNTCIPISQCPEDDNTILEKFEEGNVAFTQKFLYMAAKQNPGVSVIFSALNALILLAQLALYATGPSSLQLLRLLNLDDSNQIRSFMPNFLNTFNSEQNVTIYLVDNVYSNIEYTYSPRFKTDSKQIFNAEVQNLDFCSKFKSAEIINNWVSNKTNNLITHLIPPAMLDCDTAFVLINAIYFKDDWKYKFEPKNTQKTKFIIDKNKNVTVNMMKQTGHFKYAEMDEPGVQILNMPYENDDYSLIALLPKNKYGIDDVISKLNSRSFSLSKIINDTEYATVNVKFPIISTTTTTDLKDLLIKNNVTAIFNTETSGLINILKDPKPIEVSYAIQKATIIVTESGSEAAAASGVIARPLSLPLSPVKYIDFNADHQFLYFIMYRNTLVFAGLYAGP